jgi:hypothetical protein
MSVMQRVMARQPKNDQELLLALVAEVEALEERVARVEDADHAPSSLLDALTAKVEADGIGATGGNDASVPYLPPAPALTPALVAKDRGWDPVTYLTAREQADGEEVDGAVIMARRALCEEYSQDKPADGAPVLKPEYEGMAEPGTIDEDAFISGITGQAVDLPKPNAEAKLAWAEQAEQVMKHAPADFGLTLDEAMDAYRKGGPLWLAMYDHDYLMSLPFSWRQEMAESVILYAHDAGVDLANDILRANQEDSQDFAHSVIEGGDAA